MCAVLKKCGQTPLTDGKSDTLYCQIEGNVQQMSDLGFSQFLNNVTMDGPVVDGKNCNGIFEGNNIHLLPKTVLPYERCGDISEAMFGSQGFRKGYSAAAVATRHAMLYVKPASFYQKSTQQQQKTTTKQKTTAKQETAKQTAKQTSKPKQTSKQETNAQISLADKYYLTVRESGLVSGDVICFVPICIRTTITSTLLATSSSENGAVHSTRPATIADADANSEADANSDADANADADADAEERLLQEELSAASESISAAYNSVLNSLNRECFHMLHRKLHVSGLHDIYQLLRDGYGVQAFRIFTAYFEKVTHFEQELKCNHCILFFHITTKV